LPITAPASKARRPPRIDGDWHVEARAQRVNGGRDQADLFGVTDLVGSDAGRTGTHVEQVGAVRNQRLGASQERFESEVRAAVMEGFQGPVQDPHEQRAVGEVVPPVPEL